MKTFVEILKQIRKEAGLTQGALAKRIGVSTILISMVEAGQKEASKSLIVKLAKGMGVHPSSIAPFLFISKESQPSKLEKALISFGEKMQDVLIKEKSKNLKK